MLRALSKRVPETCVKRERVNPPLDGDKPRPGWRSSPDEASTADPRHSIPGRARSPKRRVGR
jgi:hypothetical protein